MLVSGHLSTVRNRHGVGVNRFKAVLGAQTGGEIYLVSGGVTIEGVLCPIKNGERRMPLHGNY